MLEKVKKFHKSLPQMARDREISIRLQEVVESALRSSYYDLIYEGNKREALKNHLISAMIEKRAFENARDKGECIRVAEKIADEILKISGDNPKRFFELYVKWNNAKDLIQGEKEDLSSHGSGDTKKLRGKL